MNRFLLLILLLSSLIGCNTESEIAELIELPKSQLEINQLNGTLNILIEENQDVIFQDERELKIDTCNIFISRTNINDRENDISLAVGFMSQANPDILENNEKFFKDFTHFENHIFQPWNTLDSSIPCSIEEGNTNILVSYTRKIFNAEEFVRDEFHVLQEQLEIINLDSMKFIYGNLGYLFIELEIQFTALKFSIPATGDLEFVPMNFKFSHSIRFPEIDQW